jgi:hypothetical protein
MTSLLALGDSHLFALRLAADLGLLNTGENHFCIVPGATAVGLRNPNSATNALTIFREFAASHSRSCRVIVQLGEVDCGFVVWWRLQKYGETVERQIEESLAAYRGFLLELRAMGFERICLSGASLPTIRNGVDFGEVANLRREIEVSLVERTRLTRRYNEKLASLAAELSFYYFDISDGIMNDAKGVVADYFRSPDPRDHHLDKSKVAGLWAAACNDFLGADSEHAR